MTAKINKENSSTYKTMEQNFASSFGTVFIPRTTDTNCASSTVIRHHAVAPTIERASHSRSVSLRVCRGVATAIVTVGNQARGTAAPCLETRDHLRDDARVTEIQSFHSLVSELCTGVVAGVLGA